MSNKFQKWMHLCSSLRGTIYLSDQKCPHCGEESPFEVLKMPIKAEEISARSLREWYRGLPAGAVEVECSPAQLEAAITLPGRVLFKDFNNESKDKYPDAYCAWERIIFYKESKESFHIIKSPPKIVQMIVFNNELYLATERGVYRLNDERTFEGVPIDGAVSVEFKP